MLAELGPVVDADRLWNALQDDDLVQRRGRLFAAEGVVGEQRQALPCELIDDRQHADPARVRPGSRCATKSMLDLWLGRTTWLLASSCKRTRKASCGSRWWV